jgi:hypothetical protein
MRITCNGKSVCVGDDRIVICPDAIGCSIIQGNDLYDLGFSHHDIQNSDVILEVGQVQVVIESQKTSQERKVNQLKNDVGTTETAARLFLIKNNWHYGAAKLTLEREKAGRGFPKPCGEIPLPGPSESCNLKPMGAADFQGVLTNLMPKTAEFQAVDRMKAWMEKGPPEGVHYVQVAADPTAQPVFECGCQEGMVGTEHCPVHGRNPCLTIPAPELNMECVCKEIGKAHCRIHTLVPVEGGSG